MIGPISFENDADLSVAVTAYNVEQKIPVKIIKKDSTDNNKEVSGAKFSVEVTYAADGTTEGPTTVASGAVMLLDATRGNITLEVTETKAPAGYEKVTTPKTEKITIPEGGVGLSQNVVAVDFENDPYPSVTIAKTVEGKAVSTDVVFDVYTKGTDGNFVKATYPGYTDGLTLTSGDTLRLPAGEYWLHEQVPEGNPNKILDPDQFFAQYSEKYPNTAIVQAVTKEIDGKNATFFGPFKVKDDDTTSVNWGSLDNISSVGGLTVTKQVYTGTDDNGTEQFAVKNGAEITISYKENGTDKTKKATTGTDGKATFSDLPVYNDDGSKISYTIEETKAPGNNKYDIAKETFETTLESGKTLTAEAKAGGKDLIFRNYPLRKLTVTKYVRDLWEYEFTGKQQLVQGAEIALYKLDEKGEKYTFVDSKTTGNIGQVTFDNLGEGTYVAVEVNCPEIDGQTAVPADEKELLSGKPESFAASDLEKYNYVKLEGREDVAGELINEIGWTQIKAEKVSSEIKEGEDEPRKLNGAIFELYKQVLTGNETEPLSFDPEKPGSATTLVGTYSSGTLSDQETGAILDGEFATDILEADENVVYWLVETEAAPGYEIIPSEQIILFMYPGTNHKNSSKGGEATRAVEYSLNGNSPVTIKNDPLAPGGKERFAYVRLYKWAETETAGTYKPLGGVKYKLHLSNKDGDILDFIDEMTTGLESDVKNQGSGDSGSGNSVLTGMAMSIRLNSEDYADYADPETAGTEGDIAWYGKDGNLYVRMVLMETSAPFGYQADGQYHYLIVCFKTGEQGEKALINYDETYFVFGDNTEETLASGLKGYPVAGSDTNYRLTNKPLNNYSVTVRKYGYTPVDGAYSTLNKTADELLADVNSGLLKAVNLEVTMKLQHKNDEGAWVDFQYDVDDGFGEGTEQTFTTENGYFTFPNGLLEGEYRIIEKTAPAGYELLYNDAAHARYFKVERGSQEVVMFNPSKMSLTLQKTDLNGDPVSGVSFTLNGTTKEVDNTSGKAVFENLSCLPACHKLQADGGRGRRYKSVRSVSGSVF